MSAPKFVSYIVAPSDPVDAVLATGSARSLPSLLAAARFHLNIGIYRAGDRVIALEQFDDPISDDGWQAVAAAAYEDVGELDVADGALLVTRIHERPATLAASAAKLGPDVDVHDLDDERGRGVALRVSPGRYRVRRATLDIGDELIAIVTITAAP